MANSLPSPLNVRASNSGINLKSSAARSPRPAVTEGNIGTYSHQQFISGDGIDMQALKTFIAHYYGNGIDWRPAVNTADVWCPFRTPLVQRTRAHSVDQKEHC